jgi:hypothetical protein
MNFQRKNSDNKMDLFYQDIANRTQFEEKICALYQKEFEEKLENILLYKNVEFINSLTAGVCIDLEDLYSAYVLDEQIIQDLLKKYEQIIQDTIYANNYVVLNKAWNDYVNKTDVFTIVSQFRKHCRYTKAFAKHTCDGSFIQCRKSYLHDSILMFCNKCDKNYYSAILPDNADTNLLPATWDKYHCNTMKAEKMRCIKCKDTFFYNLTENILICLSCGYRIASKDIVWNCVVCKEEFKTEARPYNAMEYKFCKQAIRQTLLLKQRAKPYSVPCCNVSIYSTIFTHKAECDGELYQGEWDKNAIVVCSKCKTMNFYDKFLWTCPKCMKRFKQKVTEEEIKEIKDTFEYKVTSHEKKKDQKEQNSKQFITPDLKRAANRSNSMTVDAFPVFTALKDLTASEISTKTPLNIVEVHEERKETKVRSLFEILEERKKINETKLINESGTKYQGSPLVKNIEDQFVTKVFEYPGINEQETASSAISEFNKFSSIYKDNSTNYNESKIEVTQTSFNENNNVVNVVKRYVTKEIDGKIIKPATVFEEPKKQERVLVRYKTIQEFSSRTPEIKLLKTPGTPKEKMVLERRIINEPQSEQKPIMKFITENGNNNKNFIQDRRVTMPSLFSPVEDKLKNFQEEIKPKNDFIKNVIIEKKKLDKFNINDYNIIKQVGEGSYGKIYLVEDRMRNKYAMKKIIAHNSTEIQAFRSEFELVHEAKHDNIMKLYGMTSNKLDMTTYVLYILMELASYDWDYEIKMRLKDRRPYSEDELRGIMKQLINCLSWLQKKNISHRDLKPQNVLYFGKGVYKLADFGEAKEVKITKQLNTIRGTELYMAPILFDALRRNKEDIAHNSYKSDVFSLGYCVIYAANLAFNCLHEIRELSNMDDITKILNKHFKHKYSQNIINCILKMIDTDENKRCDFIELESYISQNL